jgi:hypothetical protein
MSPGYNNERNEDTNSYIRRVKDYLHNNATPVKSRRSSQSGYGIDHDSHYNHAQDEYSSDKFIDLAQFNGPMSKTNHSYNYSRAYNKPKSSTRVKKSRRSPLKGLNLGIFSNQTKKRTSAGKRKSPKNSYLKGFKEMKNNKSNVSYFSRDKTPKSQKSSKSYIRGNKTPNYGANNYDKLMKKRKSQKSNKLPQSPNSPKNKSYMTSYMESSHRNSYKNSINLQYSPNQSPSLNKYRNYQNFEKVLRKSPRSKNKSFTKPKGSRSPRAFKESLKEQKNLHYKKTKLMESYSKEKRIKGFGPHLNKNKKSRKSKAKKSSGTLQGSPLLKKKTKKSFKHTSKASSSLLFRDEESNEFDSYFQLVPPGKGIFSETNFRKLKDLEFLRQTGTHLFEICSKLQHGEEVYELIRVYADMAQELEFDFLHKIFKDSDSQTLMSKVFKLERWAIILTFYFKVVKMSNQKLDNNLKKLTSETWKNHVYLINWLRMLNVFGTMSQFEGEIYDEFLGTKDDLIVQIVGVCSLIQTYIRKL